MAALLLWGFAIVALGVPISLAVGDDTCELTTRGLTQTADASIFVVVSTPEALPSSSSPVCTPGVGFGGTVHPGAMCWLRGTTQRVCQRRPASVVA